MESLDANAAAVKCIELLRSVGAGVLCKEEEEEATEEKTTTTKEEKKKSTTAAVAPEDIVEEAVMDVKGKKIT